MEASMGGQSNFSYQPQKNPLRENLITGASFYKLDRSISALEQ